MPDMELPTLADCRAYLSKSGKYIYVQYGMDRFVSDENPNTLQNTMDNIRILPIKSDPTKKDGDSDGISDFREYSLRNVNINSPLSSTQIVNYSQKLLDNNKEVFSYEQSFNLDFGWFYSYLENTPIEFNQDLSLASIIFSGLAYHTKDESTYKVSDRVSNEEKEYYYAMSENGSDQYLNLPKAMEYYGFEKVETINLREKYADNDLIQFDIGKHDIREYAPENYTGTKTKLLSIFVRGTHGTEEWMSNFDIGNTDDWTGNNDWQTKANHKGFDVAASRSLKEIHDYMTKYNINSDNTIIWLAGHSRGGAVSGILASYLNNEGYTVYSYNFAPPNQVEYHGESDPNYNGRISPNSYKGIFNIVNADDLVPQLPLTSWEFTKYGETRPALKFSGEKVEEWLTKGIDTDSLNDNKTYQLSNLNDFTVAATVEAFNKINDTRNGCYINDGNEEKELGLYKQNNIYTLTEEYPILDDFYDLNDFVHKEELNYLAQEKIMLHQKPILFMQILSIAAAGDSKVQIRFFLGDYSSTYYENAGTKMLGFSINSGMMNPHFVDAYIILCEPTT
jgi:hypothetical protein